MKLSALLHSKLFIGIAVGVTAAAAAATAFFLTRDKEEYRVIKVFETTGTSTVTRDGVGELKPYVGMNLESGDTVCTFKDSTMRISLDDTKYMFMEPETKVELEASGNKKDNKTKIVLKSGSVLNEVTKPLSSESSYEVSAPKASMAVHGTSFRVLIEKDDNGDYIITLYTFEGVVKVTLLDENGKPTDKTVEVGKDKCVKIKTVHNSSKDASEDGTSFFVFYNEKGELVPVPEGESPLMDFNYEDIPYETLKEIFDTDQGDELKLSPEILQKVIDAMTKRGNKPDNSDTSTTTTTETSSETTTEAEETTTTTTTTSSQETTLPEETTTTGGTTAPTTTSGSTTTTTQAQSDIFTVRFYDRSGSVISTQNVKKGASAKAPTNITQSYTSGGWTMLFDKWDTDYTNITEDLNVKPVYKAKQRFTVTFCDYDGKILSTQTIEKDKGATAPTNYTASYVHASTGKKMKFVNWDTSFTNIQADTVIYPVYEEATYYTVNFYNYDGAKLSSQEVEEGKAATAPTNYTKTYELEGGIVRYTFKGWDTAFTKVTSNLEVTADYTASFRVRFYDYNDTQLGSDQYVEEGKAATAPTNYTKTYSNDEGTHYTFSGWDHSFASVSDSMDIWPSYDESYEVQFYSDMWGDMPLGEPQIVAKGKSATAPTSGYEKEFFDEDGAVRYSFTGWDTSFTSVTAPIEVKPKYNEAYRVRFYDGKSALIGEAQYIAEGEDATPPTPGEDFDDVIETTDGKIGFKQWGASYENITEPVDIESVFTSVLEYKLVEAVSAIGVKTTTKTAVSGEKISLPNPSGYSGIMGYNTGWFHSYSGLKPDTTAPITAYEIKEGDSNTFVLTNYVTVPMTVYESVDNGELKTSSYTVTLYFHSQYSLLIKGFDTEEASDFSSRYDTVCGVTIDKLQFEMTDGTTLTYEDMRSSATSETATKIKTIKGYPSNIVPIIEDTT